MNARLDVTERPPSYIEIPRPDDWLLCLGSDTERLPLLSGDDGLSGTLVWATVIGGFRRGLIVADPQNPITSVEEARKYRNEIFQAEPEGVSFEPLLTFCLTDQTPPSEIQKAAETGFIKAVRLHLALEPGDFGVRDVRKLGDVFVAMGETGITLNVPSVFLQGAEETPVEGFERNFRQIRPEIDWIVQSFPKLKIVFEAIETIEAVRYVETSRDGVAATITAHHLIEKGCAATEYDRLTLLAAATSGNPKFFAGTRSLPGIGTEKYRTCQCAGCFSSGEAVAHYATIFERVSELPRLGPFLSHYGADFYGVPRNSATIRLRRGDFHVPPEYCFADDESGRGVVIPFKAGEKLAWGIEG